jgi:tripartite-type tricarboxylate transporter receptor subunit TctC
LRKIEIPANTKIGHAAIDTWGRQQGSHPMRVGRRSFAVGILSHFAFAVCGCPDGFAGNYPTKPVKIITQAPPGAGPDVILRIVADRLTHQWGQQVVVINRPGGGGLIAGQAAAAAERDGYTLYMASTSAVVVLPETHDKVSFSFDRDFVPLGLIAEQPFVIAVSHSLKVDTLADFIALAKQKPGEMTYAANSTGTLQHLTGEYLRHLTGIDVTFVPYTAGAPAALKDVMGGLIPMIIESLPALAGAIDGKIVKPLAVSSLRRLPQYPDLPTIAETVPNFAAQGWFLVFAPAGTPDPIVTKLTRDLENVLGQPDLQQRLATLGSFVAPMAPSELTAFIHREQAMWRPIVRQAGLASH